MAEGQRLIAEAVPLLQQQQPHFPQACGTRHRIVCGIAVPDQQERLREQGDLRERRLGDRQRDNRRVDPAVRQLLQQTRGQALAHMKIQTGMPLGQIADQRGQQIGRDGRDDAETQAPDQPLARRPRHVSQLFGRSQQVADPQRELLAEAGQPHLAGTAVQQGNPEGLLQLLDLHRHRRLGDRAALRRPPEMAGAGDGVEVTELFQGDVYHKLNL